MSYYYIFRFFYQIALKYSDMSGFWIWKSTSVNQKSSARKQFMYKLIINTMNLKVKQFRTRFTRNATLIHNFAEKANHLNHFKIYLQLNSQKINAAKFSANSSKIRLLLRTTNSKSPSCTFVTDPMFIGLCCVKSLALFYDSIVCKFFCKQLFR